ncbi:putative ATP-dependent DNA helicase Q1 [Alosa pseudoharengus]|uniref:putative ATP-dependent DNA helicase Q1 n=1 Tax=Alosa pseudoharengus TaxID=34774 RepID=UPI003F886696
MAAAGELRCVDSAIRSVLEDIDSKLILKEEQRNAIKAFVEKKDVFGVLPTGFGKSLIYQLAPLVAKKMGHNENPLVIVVSPLVALMEDQVKEATEMGITAMQLGVNDEVDIASGRCQLLFGSPESWLLNNKWRDMLGSDVFQANVMGIVVDEVHLTYKWGQAAKGQTPFRDSFAKLGELRSLVKAGTPVLALTASADRESRARVMKQLQMDNPIILALSPNRTNIRLGLIKVPGHTLECLHWIVRDVKEKGISMLPVIIYCKTVKAVGRVFCHLKGELGEDSWVDRDPEKKVENLLIGMFHSQTLPQNKNRVLSSLSGQGSCRVVVATTALGMGLNFPNVSHIVMYGLPDDVEAMVQQVGRAGRGGLQAHAIVYAVKQHTKLDPAVKTVLETGVTSCLRKALYCHFEEHTTSVHPGHLCCTHCHSVCSCEPEGCGEPIPKYEHFQGEVSSHHKHRMVTPEDKLLIRELLQTYRSSLLQDHTNIPLYTVDTACTGFGDELIDAVLEQCTQIFDLDFIIHNLPTFKLEHAKEILRILHEVFDDIEQSQTNLFDDSVVQDDRVQVDMDYTGYFDDEDEDEIQSSPSSLESGLSMLKISD